MIDRDAIQSNHELDEVWQNVRNFLDDLTLKGDKREIKGTDRPNRIKFTEACESFDYEKNGVITEANLHTALNRTRCIPLPTKDQIHLLCKALECYTSLNPSQGDDVNYRQFLNGPVHREFVSINGIFPKIVSTPYPLITIQQKTKEPSIKQLEDQKKKEEEERKKREEHDKEERKRKEQADKKLAEFASRRPKDMPPTKEELKIKEREDELKKLKEQEEITKRQKEETE